MPFNTCPFCFRSFIENGFCPSCGDLKKKAAEANQKPLPGFSQLAGTYDATKTANALVRVVPCTRCRKPVALDNGTCGHCGQLRTTASVPLESLAGRNERMGRLVAGSGGDDGVSSSLKQRLFVSAIVTVICLVIGGVLWRAFASTESSASFSTVTTTAQQ